MVKKNNHLLYVIKGVCGRMVRYGIKFKYTKALCIYKSNYPMVIYTMWKIIE
jgi:hypothetical protein